MKCSACGGRGVSAGPDEFGNYDPCDVCEGRGVEEQDDAVAAVQALAIRWGHEPWSDSWAELVVETVRNAGVVA